jgi:hypothetical protein
MAGIEKQKPKAVYKMVFLASSPVPGKQLFD